MNNINTDYINNLYNQNLPSLQLTQIDGFEPVQQFTDSSGQTWKLIKSANSGMCEIPDPRNLNIIDYWNHEHPSSSKIFIYVVEGVRAPKTTRETACKVLYMWFSTVNNKSFTPQMIKPNEWLTANVYAAEITDARISKLKALCKYDESQQVQQTTNIAAEPAPLIDMGLLNDKGPGTNIRSNASDNQRERAKNNR